MKLPRRYRVVKPITTVEQVCELAQDKKHIWVNGCKRMRADILQNYQARLLISMIKSKGLFEIEYNYP